ncbi:uncharacterized protein LOC126797017 isoform X2 [Argentina anserina]|uniref:uncharacterized protein LOC126797017 isoform X1 n=1 Tax=Argentina anserina TaxID=57926 RepID=UPI002176463F|nr:uncharacterized protein LOC126797017 isoform X1 [Potentilla anserina]XP_050379672.1 uncharacterized protein LOC126797017 isoform X2 [Potentilla anserina]
MFVRKLVEKASKKPGGSSDDLKGGDIDPRVVFHNGVPSGANTLAYDSIQRILAVSTKDGRIKLFGKDNTQALLESVNAVPSKFLQFVENQGILVNVNTKNHIEVWDLKKNQLAHVHAFHEDITSFKVMHQSLYMYVGDSVGNVSVLKLEQESCHILRMKYTIPYSASHGNTTEVSGNTAVMYIMPQTIAESRRVLVIYRDGLIVLWDIRESKSIFIAGVNTLQSIQNETRKVTSACWACPFGTKVVVGYNNGEIFIWSIPSNPNIIDCSMQSSPICKLNLGYKLDKIPIASLRWIYAEGKASRIYVMGASDVVSSNLLQVILLNEHTEVRSIRLGLQLPEPCIDMEIISSTFSEQSKHKQDCFLVLGTSGHLYAYDDCLIEKYLLQSQSKSPALVPKEVMVKMPYLDSSITVSKFITDNTNMSTTTDEDYLLLAKSIPSLLSFGAKPKEGSNLNAARFSGFSIVKNLYITGHSDGGINFWDLSSPLLVPILSLKQQSEEDLSLSGIALTALFVDGNSRLLVSGDQGGMVRIFRFKPEPYANISGFFSLQASTKKGNDHIVQSVRLMKVNGSVLSLNVNHSSRHLAVGSSKGHVSVIDIEGPTLLYESHIASEISTGIISLQFETCSFHGFDKNVIAVATEDSSVLALDSDNGNRLSTSLVHPKKPTRALFMQILDFSKGNSAEDAMQKQSLLLLCSEKAAYIYSFTHVMQGVKKVVHKKKFQSTCCWASTFYTPSDVGLILVYTTGKIEIRSLHDLSLVKETSVSGFTYSGSKSNSHACNSICTSSEGEVVMVNSDQEIFLFSISLQKQSFRLLDSFNCTYQKDLMVSQEELTSGRPIQKEKKKGMFSSVLKDIVGSKEKNVPEMENEDTKESIEELSTIFSTANFQSDAEITDNRAMGEHDDQLDIDDIEIDIPGEKPKEQNMLAALNKEKLASKFLAFKGKVLKQMKTKSEKNPPNEEQYDEKVGSVDEIKRRYGFVSAETDVAKIAQSKLQENTRKLQGINLKTTEMQDTAKSFSSLANQVLQTEQGRRAS